MATYALQSPPHAGAQLTFVVPASGDLVLPSQGTGLLVINPTANGAVTVSLPMPTSDGVTVGPRIVNCAASSVNPTLIPLPASVYDSATQGISTIPLTYTGTLATVQVALITIP